MDKIRHWRQERSLSLESAGRLIGVSGVQWHRYETGKRRITAERALRLAQVTGIPLAELRPDLADIFGARPAKSEASA